MTTETLCPGLVSRLDQAVSAGSVDAITRAVKGVLEEVLGSNSVDLPGRFREARPDTYARRLLHRDPAGRYTAIVMTWGVGQGTPVHDHGGLWCVEGVIDGEIAVTQYDVTPHDGNRFRIEPRGTLRAGIGDAGRLIPPTDHHIIANARVDAPSLTLHVYGGNLDGCRIFVPDTTGRYQQSVRALSYHE